MPTVLAARTRLRFLLGAGTLLAAVALVTACAGFVVFMLGTTAWAMSLVSPDAPGYQENDASIQQSVVTFTSGDKPIVVEQFAPLSEGKYPAAILVHGADGLQFENWQRYYRSQAQDLARNGYAVFFVHYFDRTSSKYGDNRSNKRHFVTWMQTLADTVTYAAQQPNVDGKRIGLIGMSLGGYLVVSVAATDERIGAVVVCFGGVPQLLADNITHMPPTLILHGDSDKIVPLREGQKLEQALRDRKMPYECKIYTGQSHGFTGSDAIDSQQRIRQFLDKHLKPDESQ